MAGSLLQAVWFISSTDNPDELDVGWQYGSTHSSLQRAFVKSVVCIPYWGPDSKQNGQVPANLEVLLWSETINAKSSQWSMSGENTHWRKCHEAMKGDKDCVQAAAGECCSVAVTFSTDSRGENHVGIVWVFPSLFWTARTSCCARKWGHTQRLMGSCQKDPEAA